MPKLMETQDVFGNTVFCDDIRTEALNGKLIYIGVYQGTMVVHVNFPFQMPMLSFGISLYQKLTDFDPNITYRIFLPGDPDDSSSDEASIVAETKEAIPGTTVKLADSNAEMTGLALEDRKLIRAQSNMQFNNLEIKQPGLIKVRADLRGNRYRLGSLVVLPAKPQTQTP
jgi:hypothetical protein